MRHWLDGGSTDADNLVLLCSHHHKIVHELGWRVGWDSGGRLVVADPDGRLLPHEPPPLPRDLADLDNPGIGAGTIRSLWAGEPLDLAATVDVLLWRRHRRGPPLFETAAGGRPGPAGSGESLVSRAAAA